MADTRYGDAYFFDDEEWRSSLSCKAAGFLALLSSEVSVFFICLLTIDHLAALRFPNAGINFRKASAELICRMTWCAGLFFASIPLIETHWHFYGQTRTCLPLPTISGDKSFDGADYSLGVLIGLNFTLFVITAFGPAFIYCSLGLKRKTFGAARSVLESTDRAITKRLIAIAVRDFLCWFPVDLVGLLASNGVQLPGHTSTALVVLVLPVNSVFKPFIYTIGVMLEGEMREEAGRPPGEEDVHDLRDMRDLMLDTFRS